MKPVYALDTTVVGLLAHMDLPASLLGMVGQHAHAIAIPAPVWTELLTAARGLEPQPVRDAFESYLWDVVFACFPIIPYDRAAAEWHAVERDRLSSEGGSISFTSGAIASIAVVNNLTLVTDRAMLYGAFAGLRTEDWALSVTDYLPDPDATEDEMTSPPRPRNTGEIDMDMTPDGNLRIPFSALHDIPSILGDESAPLVEAYGSDETSDE